MKWPRWHRECDDDLVKARADLARNQRKLAGAVRRQPLVDSMEQAIERATGDGLAEQLAQVLRRRST